MNLKILMLEDLEDDAGLIERELKKAKMLFTMKRVDTRDEFVEALDSFHPDVILSDHAMPQFNSIEALKYCRSKGIAVPFVLVTGTVSEEFAVNCLKQGVDDYILKTNLSRLPSAIISALRQREMEQQKIEAEKSLKEQNEQLLKINTELDSFVYSVSHNLRGPLASILGLVNLTRMEHIGFDHQNYFDLIEKRIQNLDHTIRQILDHYKNARMVLFPEPLLVRPVVDDILWHLEYLNNYKEVDVTVNVDKDMEIVSDHYRLSVILHNLITNAFRYIDTEKETKWISIDAQFDAGALVLTVADNGIGMKEEVQKRAFEMFFRGTSKSDGAGLGLYITRESVLTLGGSIQINSVWQEGTRIEVRLPPLPQPAPDSPR